MKPILLETKYTGQRRGHWFSPISWTEAVNSAKNIEAFQTQRPNWFSLRSIVHYYRAGSHLKWNKMKSKWGKLEEYFNYIIYWAQIIKEKYCRKYLRRKLFTKNLIFEENIKSTVKDLFTFYFQFFNKI